MPDIEPMPRDYADRETRELLKAFETVEAWARNRPAIQPGYWYAVRLPPGGWHQSADAVLVRPDGVAQLAQQDRRGAVITITLWFGGAGNPILAPGGWENYITGSEGYLPVFNNSLSPLLT